MVTHETPAMTHAVPIALDLGPAALVNAGAHASRGAAALRSLLF